MKDDLISRQAAIELCDWYEHEFSECDHIIRLITEDLKSFPPAEPERKKGEWIKQNPMVDTEECSECGYNILDEEFETPFCPYCGADMRGGINDV